MDAQFCCPHDETLSPRTHTMRTLPLLCLMLASSTPEGMILCFKYLITMQKGWEVKGYIQTGQVNDLKQESLDAHFTSHKTTRSERKAFVYVCTCVFVCLCL